MSGGAPQIYSLYRTVKVLHIFAETPYYPGGEREAGVIDLTVQRDPVTGIPIQRATGLKGAVRGYFYLTRGMSANEERVIFGNRPGENPQAGCIIFRDARILLFPAKASYDLYIYLTSVEELSRYAETLSEVLGSDSDIARDLQDFLRSIEDLEENKAVSVAPVERLMLLDGQFQLEVLQNSDIERKLAGIAEKLADFALADGILMEYLKGKVRRTLTVVGQETFSRIVNRGLERTVRIRLDYETKTVERGGMFTQELIPAGTVLYSAIMVAIRCQSSDRAEVVGRFIRSLEDGIKLNLGGDETVGRGVVLLYARPGGGEGADREGGSSE